MSICNLCHKNVKLISRSHIIPEFFYRDCKLYDNDHRIKLLSVEQTTKLIKEERRLHTGIYEKNILCPTCDNSLIGSLETYLKAIFFGGQTGKVDTPTFQRLINSDGKTFMQCTNISYAKTKLGLLSLLWRSSIAKNEFFINTKLSPDQEEELRLMLLNNSPEKIGKYPIICLSIIKPDKPYTEVIAAPRHFDHNRGSGYTILIGGMFFLFYLNHTFTELELEKYTISPHKTMTIVEVENEDGLDWIKSYIGIKK